MLSVNIIGEGNVCYLQSLHTAFYSCRTQSDACARRWSPKANTCRHICYVAQHINIIGSQVNDTFTHPHMHAHKDIALGT